MTAEPLHLLLRQATGPAHVALEHELDWAARVASLEGYRSLLARLYGFHRIWEPAIDTALSDAAFFDSRRRVAAVSRDLAFLGLSPEGIAALPSAPSPSLSGTAAAMGALYVLEGSTLGGKVIGRHVAATHGFGEDGLAYYTAHGPRTGAMWAAFRGRLDTFGDEADTVVAAANGTFDAMRRWLAQRV